MTLMILLKLIVIPILLTWAGWFPIVAAYYEIGWAVKLFQDHWLACLVATALATPLLCLVYRFFRQSPRRVQVAFGLFLVIVNFLVNFSLGHLLGPLVWGASGDLERVATIGHRIAQYFKS